LAICTANVPTPPAAAVRIGAMSNVDVSPPAPVHALDATCRRLTK
jgi:hypothetical protein